MAGPWAARHAGHAEANRAASSAPATVAATPATETSGSSRTYTASAVGIHAARPATIPMGTPTPSASPTPSTATVTIATRT